MVNYANGGYVSGLNVGFDPAQLARAVLKIVDNKEEKTMSKTVETDDLFTVYPWLDPYLSINGHSDGAEFAKKLRLAADHVRGAQALEELDIPNAIISEAGDHWEQDGPKNKTSTHPVFHGDENGAKVNNETGD